MQITSYNSWFKHIFAVLAICALCTFQVAAQGWTNVYGGFNGDEGNSVIQTENGDYVIAGQTASLGNGDQDVYLFRTDVDGTLKWENSYGSVGSDFGFEVIQHSDGGFVIIGTTFDGLFGGRDILLIKTNKSGQEEWIQSIGTGADEEGFSVKETTDGGFILSGYSDQGGNKDLYLVKMTSSLDTAWTRTFGGIGDDAGMSVIETESGDGFVVAGYTEITATNRDAYILKVNTQGTVLFEEVHGTDVDDIANDLIELDDGFVMVGKTNSNQGSIYMVKTYANGGLHWTQTHSLDNLSAEAQSIHFDHDDGFVMSGSTELTSSNSDYFILKTNDLGIYIWHSNIGNNQTQIGYDMVPHQNGGYAIVGSSNEFISFLATDVFLAVTDGLGNVHSNIITGNVFRDLDENCDYSDEEGIENWIVKATSVVNDDVYYGSTDENGDYDIAVDTGSYQVDLIVPNAYWEACQATYFLNFGSFYDTLLLDFPVKPLLDCPLLEVNIATAYLRPCMDNAYVVSYCNLGTEPALNSTVEVYLDEFMTFNSSTADVISADPDLNLYSFEVGDLLVGGCGTFVINVALDCPPEVLLGQTHCVTANIFPNDICAQIDDDWDMSNVEVTATCSDSVRLVITNTGIGNMTTASDYVIVQDDVMLSQGMETLTATQSKEFAFAADGSTYRIFVEQSPGHPSAATIVTTAIEGCNVGGDGNSLGFVTQFAEDDGDPFSSTECRENQSSFDPNDKVPFPKGYNSVAGATDNFITDFDEINYQIRFQNTGTDTAFQVIIRDTISQELDITTIKNLNASHPFSMEVYNSGILKFTFDDIYLPDSTTNEVASHGFIKFKMEQKNGNAPLTVINNDAAIYFDYNVPVITNTTKHTIFGDEWSEFLPVWVNDVPFPNLSVNVYPNPFEQMTNVVLEGFDFEELHFSVYDLTGKLLRKDTFNGNEYQFTRSNLIGGMYIYKIETTNRVLVSTGKIMIK